MRRKPANTKVLQAQDCCTHTLTFYVNVFFQGSHAPKLKNYNASQLVDVLQKKFQLAHISFQE